ncbi:MAG: hypothetical protein WA974_17860 [Thermodesulfobacteriota bacterium]
MDPPAPAEAVMVYTVCPWPASVTVNTFPAIVKPAVRLVVPVLEETEYEIVPLPMPEPVFIPIQEIPDDVIQLQ